MNDLVKRLREIAHIIPGSMAGTMDEAADEIERLRAALAECVDVLGKIDGWLTERNFGGLMPTELEALATARQALGDGK